MNNYLLSLKNISFIPSRSDKKVLHAINFNIHPLDCIMLIGANGSGKSTLLKVINGLCRPTKGSIEMDNQDLTDLPIHKRTKNIASLNQDPYLTTFSRLTVYENYLIACENMRKISPQDTIDRSQTAAECHLYKFNAKLSTCLHTPTHRLSGGERQALGLAMCLLHKPKLLILDEHTSALDPVSAKNLMGITISAIKDTKIAAIICTHNLHDALQYGNRLVAMRNGELILDIQGEEKKQLSTQEVVKIYSELIY